MIVLCGAIEFANSRAGLGLAIAEATVRAGAPVQVIGIVPDGAEGDGRLLALATRGIGHAAVLRTPPRPLEPADIELGLLYLPDVRVVIAVDGEADLDAAIADGAAFAGATLLFVASEPRRAEEADLPGSAIVLVAPDDDPDGTFAGFVGALAARLDSGEPPSDAWAATVRDLAVDAVRAAPGRRARVAKS